MDMNDARSMVLKNNRIWNNNSVAAAKTRQGTDGNAAPFGFSKADASSKPAPNLNWQDAVKYYLFGDTPQSGA